MAVMNKMDIAGVIIRLLAGNSGFDYDNFLMNVTLFFYSVKIYIEKLFFSEITFASLCNRYFSGS